MEGNPAARGTSLTLFAGAACAIVGAAVGYFAALRAFRPRGQPRPDTHAGTCPSPGLGLPAVIRAPLAVLSRGKWMQYGTVDYRVQGHPQRTYEMVSRTTRGTGICDGVCCIAYVVGGGRPKSLLLVVTYRPPYGRYVLEFPAGLVDEGETVGDAALRELLEETGFHGEVIQELPFLSAVDPWKSTENEQLVEVEVRRHDPRNVSPMPKREADEVMATLCVPLDRLRETLEEWARERGVMVESKLASYAVARSWNGAGGAGAGAGAGAEQQ